MILPKYVVINLNDKSIEDYKISKQTFEKYIGGKILAAKILYDEIKVGVDPLGEDNILIINTGPLNGTGAPASSRFNISTKNVLTGGIASSNCGGTFGFKMKRAGYDGIIIKGKCSQPSYIEIIDGQITIKDATDLWGLDTEKTQEQFDKKYGKLVIGPAGENLVKYACCVSGERVAGRCGVGAVMGSKNIKAIVAYGTKVIHIENEKEFKKNVKVWIDNLKKHHSTGVALPTYGTAGLVDKCNASNILPTKNFQRGRYENADDISAQNLTENYLTRNGGCVSCPIRCERRVMVEGKEVKGPEFETLGLLGPNIDNSSLELINKYNYYADILGMDTISLGATISFAMELKEKGIKDFGVEFGNGENVVDIIHKIAYREDEYYELGEGSKILSEKYGGKEFAMHSKGMEISSYHPNKSVGMGLGYATSNRGGCHINGGYLVLLENLSPLVVDQTTPKSKAELTILFQNMLEALSAAGFCIQTSQAVIPNLLFKLNPSGKMVGIIGKSLISSEKILRVACKNVNKVNVNSMKLMPYPKIISVVTGINMNIGKFFEVGERGYNIERLFNVREGFNAKDDTLCGRLKDVPLDKMLPVYYSVRGWNENGIPKNEKLEKLGIIK